MRKGILGTFRKKVAVGRGLDGNVQNYAWAKRWVDILIFSLSYTWFQ